MTELSRVATASDPALTVRFPEWLLEALRQAAPANGRSMNTEIIFRLADSVEAEQAGARTKKSG